MAKDLNEKDVVEQQDAERNDSLGRELSRIDTSDFPSAFPLAMITVASCCPSSCARLVRLPCKFPYLHS